jgi:hypothetical protein
MMPWFFKQLLHKLLLSLYRAGYYLMSLPLRFFRLGLHFHSGFRKFKAFSNNGLRKWKTLGNKRAWLPLGNWTVEFHLLLLDLIGIGEIYGTVADWIKFNSRPLENWEIELARSIYGDSIYYRLVTVDDHTLLGVRWNPVAKAYVSYHTINTQGVMENSLLIHELIHVWQYQRFGSVYAFRALLAQHSQMGYNYGGLPALQKAIAQDKDFTSFNFEQQGDLVQDYYLIKNNYRPTWGRAHRGDLHYYEHFIKQLNS